MNENNTQVSEVSPTMALGKTLIQKRQHFRHASQEVITDFLEGRSVDEQLALVQEALGNGEYVAMQAFAYSDYEAVQQAVVDWLNSDEAFDPFVAAILCESRFENIASMAADCMEVYCGNFWGITQYFQSFA